MKKILNPSSIANILCLILILFAISMIFAKSNAKAQVATVQCQITQIVFDGTDHPPSTWIPTNKDFGLKLTCLPGFSSTKTVSVTFNGVTKSVPGLTGVLNTQFGFWNFSTAYAGGITVSIPGETVLCSPVCSITMDGDPVPTTLPPVPETDCPTGFSYNPTTPQLNQPFQVIFPIPESIHGSLNGDIAPVRYRFVYLTQPGNEMGDYPLIVNNGRWIVSYPAVSGSTNWSLLETVGSSTPTCLSDNPFDEKDSGTPGKNPCTGGECETGLGRISTNFGAFASRILLIALGVGGGLALIFMVFGAIRVMTSSGNPQAAAQGREIMTAAVAGLLFIAFAVLILQFIGVVIVPIPGLTFGIPI